MQANLNQTHNCTTPETKKLRFLVLPTSQYLHQIQTNVQLMNVIIVWYQSLNAGKLHEHSTIS